MGIREQIIFPEIDIDKVSKLNGMDITFVTTANTDVECHSLLTELGLPFKKNSKRWLKNQLKQDSEKESIRLKRTLLKELLLKKLVITKDYKNFLETLHRQD